MVMNKSNHCIIMGNEQIELMDIYTVYVLRSAGAVSMCTVRLFR